MNYDPNSDQEQGNLPEPAEDTPAAQEDTVVFFDAGGGGGEVREAEERDEEEEERGEGGEAAELRDLLRRDEEEDVLELAARLRAHLRGVGVRALVEGGGEEAGEAGEG